MEKSEIYEKTIKCVSHTFYCDKCNQLIGRVEEEEDGYYKDLGEYELSFHIPKIGWFGLNRHLCDECKIKLTEEVKQTLLNLGFGYEE